ncbi:MAG: hypothetical protein ACHQVS_03980 [Candidatus Babeliales bacterium]
MSYLKNIALAMAITSGLCVIYTYTAETKESAAKRKQQELDTQLINAIYTLDLTGVKQALAQGANANQTIGEDNRPYLIYETYSNTTSHEPTKVLKSGLTVQETVSAIITELVKHGAQADYRTLEQIIFSYPEDPYPLQVLIGLGVNINQRSDTGVTLLMNAADLSNLAAFDLLLSNGADINAIDSKGNDIMYYIDTGLDTESAERDTMRKHLKTYRELQEAAKKGQAESGNPLIQTVTDYLGAGATE